MLVTQPFEEIRVYAGIAERTGVRFNRNEVRRSANCCGSWTQLKSKSRDLGDGLFYLPLDAWPGDELRLELRKPWVVIASGSGQ
jgi:hypothetical protein